MAEAVTMLPLARLTLDPGVQSRARLDPDTVADYAALIGEGADFPPVVAFFDGQVHWLASGFHRFHAHRAAGRSHIKTVVRQGGRREAVLLSVGCNQKHGLRRTNADKRRAVGLLLDDPEWSLWPNRRIAEHTGVSEGLLRIIRRERESPIAPPPLPEVPPYEAPARAAESTAARLSFAEDRPAEAPYARPVPAAQRVEVPLSEADGAELRGRAARLVRKLCRAAKRLGCSPEDLLAQYRPG